MMKNLIKMMGVTALMLTLAVSFSVSVIVKK